MIKKSEMFTHIYIHNLGSSACFSITISAIHPSPVCLFSRKQALWKSNGNLKYSIHTHTHTHTHTYTVIVISVIVVCRNVVCCCEKIRMNSSLLYFSV